MSKKLVNL